jgi:hypothetical protein
MLSEEFIREAASVLTAICVAGLVIGLVYLLARNAAAIERLFVRFGDYFLPRTRPTHAKMEETVEVWRSRCAKLKEENERLKAHIQQLIESGKQDQERIRASFPKPKGEFDTEDDG